MRKNKILNICMVLTIIFSLVCGIMAVGSVKGWFESENKISDLTVSEKTGISMIERSGIAYEVTNGTVIRTNDKLYTKTAASLTISKDDKSIIYMGDNVDILVSELGETLKCEVLKGYTLVDARGQENVTVISGKTQAMTNQAVVAVSTQAGSSMFYVYAGELILNDDTTGKQTIVPSGKVITIAVDSDICDISELTANNLSDTQIEQLKKCGLDNSFCFTEAELNKVQKDREAKKMEAQQEALKQKDIVDNSDETETKNNPHDSTDNHSSNSQTEKNEEPEKVDAEDEEYVEPEKSPTCTIKIVCNTILDNKGNLTPGKEGYVPSSGTILGTTTVEFSEGETVFDVLKRVCNRTGVQIEYSYTPIYESYYIEGINHIYEFDCGPQSGWMYKVNGWFPNYGCSNYYVKDGDSIIWSYTCNGLGADVGA